MLNLADSFPDILVPKSMPVKWILITIPLLLLFYSFNRLFTIMRILWTMACLPGPRIHPILGDMKWLIDYEQFHEMRRTFRKLYGPVIKFWNFFFPIVFVVDPADIQKILGSSKHLQKPFYYSFFKNFIGDGLVTSDVSTWRIHRKLLQPYFHVKYIEEYLPVFNKGSRMLNEAFEQHLEKSTNINITLLVNKSTLCILCESVLGLDLDPKTAFTDTESLPYRQDSNKFVDRLFQPFLEFDFIYKRTNEAKREANASNFRMDFTKKLIKQRLQMRQQGCIKNTCYLDYLLDISEYEDFSEEDCLKEASTLILAGQDTVATTLAFSLHQIANHADVQEKINNELELIFGDSNREPTASDVRQMIYLEQCIKETMRLYPAIPIVLRTLGEDVKMGNYDIPKGITVMILPWLTHYLDEFYPDPEKFNPDRFAESEREKRHPYAYIPFSAGLRNCIGYKVAVIEIKTIIANILRKYRLTPVPGKEKLNVTYKVTTRAVGGVWINLTPKKNSDSGS